MSFTIAPSDMINVGYVDLSQGQSNFSILFDYQFIFQWFMSTKNHNNIVLLLLLLARQY